MPAFVRRDALVTALVMTYNHSRYVVEALESALAQDVGGGYEILVADDCSTDGTRDIVREYSARYPNLIRLLPVTANVGENRVRAAGALAARGLYVALLDGDDYWTSPQKLRRQIDFLEQRSDCALCFHNALVVYDDEREDSHPFHSPSPTQRLSRSVPRETSTLEDLAPGNFMQTSSVMFRAGLVGDFPDWYFAARIPDWAFHVLHAEHGSIGYIDALLSAYRVHPGGAWSDRISHYREPGDLADIISIHDAINRHLGFRYDAQIRRQTGHLAARAARLLAAEGSFDEAAGFARRALADAPNLRGRRGRLRLELLARPRLARVHSRRQKGRQDGALTGTPAVSVVMPVYNGERFVREAIKSVLSQTLAEFELIVIDDGSTDSTPEILDAYRSEDRRIVVERITRRGRPAALNHGFALARAPFVARLDADDVALPKRLARQREFLLEHENVGVVGGAVAFVDPAGDVFAEWQYPLTDGEIRRTFARATPIAHPAAMVRNAAFAAVGGYRAIFGEADDVDLWLRIAERYDLANVPDLVVRYRIHPGQATFRHLELQTLCDLAARRAALARLEGRGDPISDVDRIDAETVRALGVSDEEITSALVHKLVWVARMIGRAGDRRRSEELLDKADDAAASPSGSAALAAYVARERAALDAVPRRWLRGSARTVRTLATAARRRR